MAARTVPGLSTLGACCYPSVWPDAMGDIVQLIILMGVVGTGRDNRASTLISHQNQYKLLSTQGSCKALYLYVASSFPEAISPHPSL